MKRNFFVFILYGILSLFFLRGVLLSSGIIIGSDWSLPLTTEQMAIFGKQGFSTWSNYGFGSRVDHLNAYLFSSFVSWLARAGINGMIFNKVLLIFFFFLIGFSAFCFCRKIGLTFKSSLLGGFVYMTTPLMFNYSIMGWVFILLVMAIIPIFLLVFKLSIEKEKTGYAIIAGFLFAIAMFQSQAAFWLPLLMIASFPFLASSWRRLFLFVRSFLIVFFIGLAIHANWLFPLIFSPSTLISKAVSLYDIQRFEIRLSFINILRLWGGLFNYQFETAYPKFLLPISFILPMLAFLALILRRKDKKILHLAAIALLPLGIYSLRGVLYRIPFSNIIRDFGRMMILSAFPYSVLAAITFEELGKLKKEFASKFFLALTILLIFLNSLPFWSGELYGEPKMVHDQRLRTLKFPTEYQKAEEYLLEDHTDTKALWLPSGMSLGFLDNEKFYGPYKEAADIFALLSQKPGAFAFSDKTIGPSVDYGKLILNAIENSKTTEFRNLLKLTSINNFVVRKNAYGAGGEGPEIERTIQALPDIIKVFDEPKVSIYQNDNFLPHFYIPQDIVYSPDDIGVLQDIVSFKDYEVRSGIYLAGSTDNADGTLITLKERADEVFVKAKLEDAVDEEYFEKKETLRNSVPFPYVKHEPGSLGWKLARLKERYYEWKVRNDKEKLLDKKLFYASKRISEFEKWGGEKDTEYLILILNTYKEKMGEVIEEIEKLRNSATPEIWEEMLTKLRAYWERHKEKMEEIVDSLYREEEKEKPLELADDVFSQLDREITLLEKKFDLRNLEYSFEIPKEGEYTLFAEDSLVEIEKLKNLKIELDGEQVSLEKAEARRDGWVSLAKKNFKEGEHKLVLHLSEPENLVRDDWQKVKEGEVEIKKEGFEFSSQELFPDAKNLVFQEIDKWLPNNFYHLSFNYKTEGSSWRVGILEERTENQERERATKTEKLFEKVLETKKLGDWEKFERVVKTGANSLGAKIYFYTLADSDQFAKVDFRNLMIAQLIQPKLVLKSTTPRTSHLTPQTPKITFVKINPTKYKVEIEEAKDPYTLVFSESFHQGWKAYIKEFPISNFQFPNSYGEIVGSYFDGEIKEGNHKNIFLDRDTFETWGKKPISEERHFLVNGYANSWYITPEDSGGAENYEVIIEFWPQRLFYIGLGISLATLLGCLGYLGYDFAKRKIERRK